MIVLKDKGAVPPQALCQSGRTSAPRFAAGRAAVLAIAAIFHESGVAQVFGRRRRRSNHALWRPAAENRQCTKSRREIVGLRLPRESGAARKAMEVSARRWCSRGEGATGVAMILQSSADEQLGANGCAAGCAAG